MGNAAYRMHVIVQCLQRIFLFVCPERIIIQ
jgi:hypothetical protein